MGWKTTTKSSSQIIIREYFHLCYTSYPNHIPIIDTHFYALKPPALKFQWVVERFTIWWTFMLYKYVFLLPELMVVLHCQPCAGAVCLARGPFCRAEGAISPAVQYMSCRCGPIHSTRISRGCFTSPCESHVNPRWNWAWRDGSKSCRLWEFG